MLDAQFDGSGETLAAALRGRETNQAREFVLLICKDYGQSVNSRDELK
jgi:hypothetical protein